MLEKNSQNKKLKLVSLDEMGLHAPSKMHWEQTDSIRDVFLLFWWGPSQCKSGNQVFMRCIDIDKNFQNEDFMLTF